VRSGWDLGGRGGSNSFSWSDALEGEVEEEEEEEGEKDDDDDDEEEEEEEEEDDVDMVDEGMWEKIGDGGEEISSSE
jgi:hypothetical protein